MALTFPLNCRACARIELQSYGWKLVIRFASVDSLIASTFGTSEGFLGRAVKLVLTPCHLPVSWWMIRLAEWYRGTESRSPLMMTLLRKVEVEEKEMEKEKGKGNDNNEKVSE